MQATLEAIETSNVGGRWATDAKGTEKPSGAWHQEVVNRNETTPLSARTGWRLSGSSGVTFISGTSS